MKNIPQLKGMKSLEGMGSESSQNNLFELVWNNLFELERVLSF